MEEVAEREWAPFDDPLRPVCLRRLREPLGDVGAHRVDVVLVLEGLRKLGPDLKVAMQHFFLFCVEVRNSIVDKL